MPRRAVDGVVRAWRRRRLAERMVWVLGSPRSGSTWLLSMLATHPSVHAVDEPLVGLHLGATTEQIMRRHDDGPPQRVVDVSADRPGYVFARPWQPVWGPGLRRLVLDRYGAEVAAAGARPGAVVLKEPHGSEAADVISAVLPDSRLLVLVRDGRDVVDSELDAVRPGAWGAGALGAMPDDQATRLEVLREQAQRWVLRTEVVLAAVARHDPLRVRVLRYEDLLADTCAEMSAVLSWAQLAVPDDLRARLEPLAFAALPADDRGPGRFARAATPGLWRESFDEEEQALLLEVMGDALGRLGYES